MKTLYSYLIEKFNTMTGRILIFDVDDTLLHTQSKTRVMKDGEIIHELTAAEFNNYKLKDGEYFDFSEFSDIEIMNKGIFTRYWNTLKREYNRGTHISIVTARSKKSVIMQFFKEHGFPIRTDLCKVINDPGEHYTGSVEERKAQAIKELIDAGYSLLIFFDDSEANLKSAKELEKQYPDITIKTIHVK